jgi:antitoxin ParD1/3/4
MAPDSIPQDLGEFLQNAVASGRYQSEAEVICEGLRLLRDRERRIQSLREELKPALEELDRGEGKPLDPDSIKAEGRRRLEAADNRR